MLSVPSLLQLSARLEQTVAPTAQPLLAPNGAPQSFARGQSSGGSSGAEPPKDSIEGAVLSLLHSVIDGIVGATPRTMQVSSAVNRSTRPIQVQLKGRNSQGLYSLLSVRVDLDATLQGLRADVWLQLQNQQNQPVADQHRGFVCRRNESVKAIVKQFGEWLSQAEALQMAPVSMTGQPVMM